MASLPRLRRPRWASIAKAVAGAVALMILFLYLIQDRLIYFPRPYPQGAEVPSDTRPIRFTTGQGAQVAFYRGAAAPERIWVAFGGNASLALEWSHLIAAARDPSAGFLLIDYPGYGLCAGKPSPRSMRENADGALAALALALGQSLADLERHLGVLGHSLGAGAALAFACGHPCERAVLVSPFTSLRDMARRTAGWPLCWLLKQDLDNRARLRELLARAQPPRVTIFHGDADEVIPVAMGRELARDFPGIDLRICPGSTHNGILEDAQDAVLATLIAP